MTRLPLWAIDQSRWENIASGMKPRPVATDDLLIVLGILVGIGLLIWGLAHVLSLRERRRNYSSPLRLFVELCRAHQLKLQEGWLLWQLARAQQLSDPARLFLEPQRLAPANLPPKMRLRAATLAGLRQRLFIEPPVEENDEQPAAASAPAPAPAATATAKRGPTPLMPTPPAPALDVPLWVPDAVEPTSEV